MNSLMKLGSDVWSAVLRFAIWAGLGSVLDLFGSARLTVTSSCSLVLAKLSSALNFVITHQTLQFFPMDWFQVMCQLSKRCKTYLLEAHSITITSKFKFVIFSWRYVICPTIICPIIICPTKTRPRNCVNLT